MTVVLAGLIVASSAVAPYRIATGSMEPVFPEGTVVMVGRGIRPKINHAVTFMAEGRIVTHVLVGYATDGSLITRGVANQVNDHWRSPVTERDVLGRVLFGMTQFSPSFWTHGRILVAISGAALAVVSSLLYRVVR